MVTIKTVFNPTEAQLIRSRLEVAGFHPELINETASESFGGVPIGSFGIRVELPDAEAVDAKELLDSSGE